MSNVLFQTIDQISREKGIDPQIVIHAIEDAIVVASRKYFKSNEDLRGRINPETGEIDVSKAAPVDAIGIVEAAVMFAHLGPMRVTARYRREVAWAKHGATARFDDCGVQQIGRASCRERVYVLV